MQTVVQVMCTKGESLRSRIAGQRTRLKVYNLTVESEKIPGRRPGWMNMRSTDPARRGALKITWHAATKILTCRVVSRGTGKPNLIIGEFLDFLLRHHSDRIKFISIFRV